MYTHRFYRTWVSERNLSRFRILLCESDIQITAGSDLTVRACEALHSARESIEKYIALHPGFDVSMIPVERDDMAPGIVSGMIDAALSWNVGPMAAVAGAIAEDVGRCLLQFTDTVLVENGGDIFLKSSNRISCALYAGEASPFRGYIGFAVKAPHGIGICTSSGTVGHSFSRGEASAVTVLAGDSATADAAATAIANRIRCQGDIDFLREYLTNGSDLIGVIACCGGKLASLGVELFETDLGRDV